MTYYHKNKPDENYQPQYLDEEFIQKGYKADDFQLSSFEAIDNNEHVLVRAHTGAGKTLIAEYAIRRVLSFEDEDQKIIYTSPIKTLSNQKFHEFGKKYGQENVGILTGDIKVNTEARVLIMTAEILRNALDRNNYSNQDNQVYDFQFNPSQCHSVIFDEVHYINDPHRGTVWEETMINLPKHIQMIMLSATIDGIDAFSEWIVDIKQRNLRLTGTNYRPVPLRHYIFYQNELNLILEGDKEWDESKYNLIRNDIFRRNKVTGTDKKKEENRVETFNSNFKNCIRYLDEKKRLPAIFFVLNRKYCEELARTITTNLVDHNEIAEIEKIFFSHLKEYRRHYEYTHQWNQILSLLKKGIGIHHSGIIPILKEIVEILYSHKLVKVLIATETFAVGVNMPTKTVVFPDINKFDGKEKRILRSDEYKQMAGRAGRRGLDDYGEVIILPNNLPFEGDFKKMATGKAPILNSKLEFSYNIILKKLANLQSSDSNIDKDKRFHLLTDIISNSLFGKQLIKDNKSVFREKESVLAEEPKLTEELNELMKNENFLRWLELKETVDSGYSGEFQISQKQKRKYISDIKKIEAENNFDENNTNFMKNIDLYYNHQDWKSYLSKIDKQIDDNNQLINTQITNLVDFLISNDYINQEYQLTLNGVIAKELTECNSIILSQSIKQNLLKDITFPQLVGIMSCFVIEKSDQNVGIDDLLTDNSFNDKLNQISLIAEEFGSKEAHVNNYLMLNIWSEWDLSLDMFNSSYMWADGKTWKETAPFYSGFEGNFIKNIIRINNFIRDLENIATIIRDTELLRLLNDHDNKLIRDIVTLESLYIN